MYTTQSLMEQLMNQPTINPNNVVPVDDHQAGVAAPALSTQGANYNIVGGLAVHQTAMPTMDPTPASGAFVDPYWNVTGLLNKIQPIASVKIDNTMTKGHVIWTLPVPSGLVGATTPQIQAQFKLFHYWRGNISVMARPNTTAFNKGALRFYFIPQGQHLQYDALSPAHRTVNQGEFIDTAAGKAYTLNIPYCARQEAIHTSFQQVQGGLSTDIGVVYLVVEAKIDVCKPVSIQISGWFPGSQLMAPVVTDLGSVIPSTMKQVIHRKNAGSYPWNSAFEYELLKKMQLPVDIKRPYDAVEKDIPSFNEAEVYVPSRVPYPVLKRRSDQEPEDAGVAHGNTLGGGLLGGVLGGGGGKGGSLLSIGGSSVDNHQMNIGSVSNVENGTLYSVQTQGNTSNQAAQKGGDQQGKLDVSSVPELDRAELPFAGVATYHQELATVTNLRGIITSHVKLNDDVLSRRENNQALSGIGVNEQLIPYMTSRPTQYSDTNLVWKSTDEVGTVIAEYDVTACPQLNAQTLPADVYPDLAEAVVSRFEQWKAEIIFRFIFVTDIKLRGTLMATFIPFWEDALPTHLPQGSQAYATTITLTGEQKTFEVRIPYIDQTISKYVHRAHIQGLNKTQRTVGAYSMDEEMRKICTGKLVLWVANELCTGGTSSEVTCENREIEIIVLRYLENAYLAGRSPRNDYMVKGVGAERTEVNINKIIEELGFAPKKEPEDAGDAHAPVGPPPINGTTDVTPWRGNQLAQFTNRNNQDPIPDAATAIANYQSGMSAIQQMQQIGAPIQVQPAKNTGEQAVAGNTNSPSTIASMQTDSHNDGSSQDRSAAAGLQESAQPDTFSNAVRMDVKPGITSAPLMNRASVFGTDPMMQSIMHLPKRPQTYAVGKFLAGASTSGFSATTIPTETLVFPVTVGQPAGQGVGITNRLLSGTIRSELDYWGFFFMGWMGNLQYTIIGDYPSETVRKTKHWIRFFYRNLPKMKGVSLASIKAWQSSQGAREDWPNTPFHMMSDGKHGYVIATPFTRFGYLETLGFDSYRTGATRQASGLQYPILYRDLAGDDQDNISPYTAANFDIDRVSGGTIYIGSDPITMVRAPPSGADASTNFEILRAAGDNFSFIRLFNVPAFTINGSVGDATVKGTSFPDLGADVPVTIARTEKQPTRSIFINGQLYKTSSL